MPEEKNDKIIIIDKVEKVNIWKEKEKIVWAIGMLFLHSK